MLHWTGLRARKHERSAEVARRTDRTEHIGVGVTLILGLARTRSLLGPLIDQAVLLPDPHFVLEPDLDRQSRCYALAGDRLRHPLRKVFLKASMTCGSCLGCRGRGLTCAKPSSLRARPIDTSSRSTSKRSSMTRLRSTHRHRTTPSMAGSGPASTIRFNSCFCSDDSFGRGPGALPLTLRTLLVVPVRPVPQRLSIHRANLGGGLTAHPVEYRRQRQQPPRLICILCPFRQHPQFARTQIRAQSHRCTHRLLANHFR